MIVNVVVNCDTIAEACALAIVKARENFPLLRESLNSALLEITQELDEEVEYYSS